ncbi:MAG: metallophosphoesterase [Myxococcales bacterium]
MMRVLHFSDVHVQEAFSAMPVGELMGKRLLAAGNLFLVRGRLFKDVPQKLQALAEFARSEQPDLVICTGDYTAVGSEAEYAAARRAMEPFLKAPLGFCTVPGNHDLYLSDTLRERRFERHFGDLLQTELPELAVDGLFPYVRFVGDQLAVVGINSAKPNPNPFASSGYVSAAQLTALEHILRHPKLADRWTFVITHYGFLREDGTPDKPKHGLDNANEVLQLCTRPRVALLHGHIHHNFSHAPTAEHPWLFCAGSATHRGREGLWIYEFEGARVRAIPGQWDRDRYKLEHSRSVILSAEGP